MVKKDFIVSFRITTFDATRMTHTSHEAGRSLTDWCRAVCLKEACLQVSAPARAKRLRPRNLPALDTQALARLCGQIGKVGSNVNQLAKIAHTVGKIPELALLKIIQAELTKLKIEIQEVLAGGAHGD